MADARLEQLAPAIDARVLERGGLFVTGTDTGIGKTLASAAVARGLRSAGLRVGAMKPVQTGTADEADDLAFVVSVGGVDADMTSRPCAFPEPLAPLVAGMLAGTTIDLDRITMAFAQLRGRADVVVVEGSGGLLVPVTEEATMADLALALGLPLVVVARPGLGTLNHCALTIEAARIRGLEVIGVILSGFPETPGISETTNPPEIERIGPTELVGVIPRLEGLDVDRKIFPPALDPRAWIAPSLGGSFDREWFLTRLESWRTEHVARA